MKRAVFSVLLCTVILVFCFTGCRDDALSGAAEELVASDTVAVSTDVCFVAEVEEPSYSPLAKAQFLEPVESFSWEREFALEYVMIHFTSAVMLSRDNPYDMEAIRKIFIDGGVSVHYIIDRGGEVYCYIPETRAAWHAGKGAFSGEERLTNAMNKYSVGIELVAIGSGNDMAQYLTDGEYAALDEALIGFTDAQYESLSLLVADICERNGIPFDRGHVIGHSEYNSAKSDPGELFDWNRLVKK